MPNTISNQTYNTEDLNWKMFAQTTFNGCTFHGIASNCNFAEATFVNCTIDADFKFVNCNLGGVEGLPERYPCSPRRSANSEPEDIRRIRMGHEE